MAEELNLSIKVDQIGERYYVETGTENILRTPDGREFARFPFGLNVIVEGPDDSVICLTEDLRAGRQNIFYLDKHAKHVWTVESPKIIATEIHLRPGPLKERKEGYSSVFFEGVVDGERRYSMRYRPDFYLAALYGYNDLYRIDLETGKVEYDRYTGLHAQD